jgi:hypothetical protein
MTFCEAALAFNIFALMVCLTCLFISRSNYLKVKKLHDKIRNSYGPYKATQKS